MKKYNDNEATLYHASDDESTSLDTRISESVNRPAPHKSSRKGKSSGSNSMKQYTAIAGGGFAAGSAAAAMMTGIKDSGDGDINVDDEPAPVKHGEIPYSPEVEDSAEVDVIETVHTAESITGLADELEVESVIEHADYPTHESTDEPEIELTSGDLSAEMVEPEIEVIGVVHENDFDTNVGVVAVNGQPVILLDVDNDLSFDYMASDFNGNGRLDEDECVDIQSENITVNDLGGFSNPIGDFYASNDDDNFGSE